MLQKDGTWAINNLLFMEQVAAAKLAYDSAESLLGKVNALNKYQSFLLRNFGQALLFNKSDHAALV